LFVPRLSAAYAAFVASKVKAGRVLECLRDRGVTAARLSQVRSPAGLDIPEEIAVSILAEIIQVHGAKPKAPQANLELPLLTEEAKDPICGMSVDVGAAKYKSEFQGNSFYFCCAGCKQTFDKQRDKYALATAERHRRPGNLHSGCRETSFTFCFALRRCGVNTWKAG
jgi:xanthine dehydrogenase accessory factor